MPPALNQNSTDLEIVISREEFKKFCDFFYRQTGILFESHKKYFVERRIIDRMEKAGCKTFREYFSVLKLEADGEEMQRLVNQMTVNETYFFREDYQFEALVSGILPAIATRKSKGQTIRIWSLPCSSGEEPYSLAIYILEHWQAADRFDIQILGSDIDSSILAQAAAGVYGERALQRLGPELRRTYFTAQKGGEFRISEGLRGSVDFSRVNVIDPQEMAQYLEIDVLFCRNMLIYFDDKSRSDAITLMYQCMSPGGYILLGHSESMSRMSDSFVSQKFGETIVYQKPFGTAS